MKPFFLLACFCVFTTFARAQELQNLGFENAYTTVAPTGDTQNQGAKISGAVTENWEDNSAWADVGVNYARETQNPHGGATCQRIEVTRVDSGAQQFVQPVKLQKDHSYLFGVWLRGTTGKIVSVWIRKQGDPYTTYGQAMAVLSPQWQQFRVVALVPEDAAAFLMVRAAEPMTYCVDDAEFGDAGQMVSQELAQKGNILSDGGFELKRPFGWNTRVQGSPDVEFRDPQPTPNAPSPGPMARISMDFRALPESEKPAMRIALGAICVRHEMLVSREASASSATVAGAEITSPRRS